eukprot:363764-Chlamydomonas_euryale.AAC.22
MNALEPSPGGLHRRKAELLMRRLPALPSMRRRAPASRATHMSGRRAALLMGAVMTVEVCVCTDPLWVTCPSLPRMWPESFPPPSPLRPHTS